MGFLTAENHFFKTPVLNNLKCHLFQNDFAVGLSILELWKFIDPMFTVTEEKSSLILYSTVLELIENVPPGFSDSCVSLLHNLLSGETLLLGLLSNSSNNFKCIVVASLNCFAKWSERVFYPFALFTFSFKRKKEQAD